MLNSTGLALRLLRPNLGTLKLWFKASATRTGFLLRPHARELEILLGPSDQGEHGVNRLIFRGFYSLGFGM